MRIRFLHAAVCVGMIFSFGGCSSFSRDKTPEISSSMATADGGLTEGTRKVVAQLHNIEFLNPRNDPAPATICFLGVQNLDGKPIPALEESVRRQFRQTTSFRLLDTETIDAAVKKAEIKRNNVYIPENREKFLAALSIPVHYMLEGRIITLPDARVPNGPLSEEIVFSLYCLNDNSTARLQNPLSAMYQKPPRKKTFGIF